MTDREIEERLEIGREAEEFLEYIYAKPYFKNLCERMRVMLLQAISELSPEQKDAFMLFKTRFDFIPEFENTVKGDIYLAQEALKAREGIKEQGIL